MKKQFSSESLLYPVHINIFAIPNESAIKRVYEVYKPSAHTICLQSEQGRTIYPEVFIENIKLGTLVDLCVRALARSFGPNPMSVIANEHLLLQVHYDALDVNMPLSECYHISEERFWKRLVLTKHPDKSLVLKHNLNWKNLGISIKYVELVESSPVEHWPEEEMRNLALKIKDFVNEMHLKRLQSLKESSFEKYFLSESESSTEDEDEHGKGRLGETKTSVPTSEEENVEDVIIEEENTKSQLELQNRLKIKKAQREKARQVLREASLKANVEKEAKQTGDAKRNSLPKTKYDYPAEHCHHIDLSFVQYFTNLETFTIAFLGPLQARNYHKRHMNFSHDDIKRLSIGIGLLPKLRIFRLRYSRMDMEKLITLCCALSKLENLETLDLGYDDLNDGCGIAFVDLFKNTTSIRFLELESNQFGEKVLGRLGIALKSYMNGQLEYLGLARNPITHEALHALVTAIIGSKHITSLNLKGITHMFNNGISCCIANELLRKHPILRKLDLSAVRISEFAANEIVKALNENKTILEFKCYACELDEQSKKDIKIILKRNQYVAENPYLGDTNVTEEEINAWLNRTKNPILLKVLAEREKCNECLENRPQEYIPLPITSSMTTSSQESLNFLSHMYEQQLSEYSSFESTLIKKYHKPFVYAANEFNDKEFLEHISQPGPQERYNYFKMRKQKYMVRDISKNISMV